MQYRITTQETILRQYLISAPSEAAALEYTGRYMGTAPARRLLSEDGPVATHPERIEHIEEEPEELARREREGSEYEPLNWPLTPGLDCPRCGRIMAIPIGGGSECRYHGCPND